MLDIHRNSSFVFVLAIFLWLPAVGTTPPNNCPNIPAIDGGPCGICTPTGWDPILTPDIVNGSSWFTCDILNGSQSPTGGNSVLLYGTGNNSEGMTTDLIGLQPGAVYNIGFYWLSAVVQCPLQFPYSGGELLITIAGNEFSFSGASNWELVQLCYTATSTVETLTLSIEANGPAAILVDSADCDELETCCDLEVEIAGNEILCPGDVLQFDANYSEEQGAVTIEWTSSPADGVDFLNDPTIIDPIFTIPDIGDYFGERYIFTLTVSDNVCDREDEFILEVTPNVVPEFEIDLCQLFIDYEFPSSSLDPYFGTWEGDFDFANLGGTTQDYVFTLDDGQNNCLEEHTYTYDIAAAETTSFELPESYCLLDKETYFLPFTTIEGIEGTWDINFISPDRLTPDFYSYTFTPDPLLHCAYDYVYEFEIREPKLLTFNIPSTFCIVQQDFQLPSASLEGIQGDWNVDFIDVSNVGADFVVTFTPEEIEDCYYPYDHHYSITTSIPNTFVLPDSICSEAGIFQFPSTTLEGYDGTWNPLAFDLDTIFGNEIGAVWTPTAGQSECVVPSFKSVVVERAGDLLFNLPDTLCIEDGVLTLPIFDQMFLSSGSWSVPSFDPNVLSPGEHESVFTVDPEYCFEPYIFQFEIVELHAPIFSLVTGFCPSQAPVILPLISDDGFSGQWTTPIIDPGQPGISIIQSTFIPNPGQAQCLVSYTETFTVDLLIDPEFLLPTSLCSVDGTFEFPTTSNNGIIGTWDIPVLDFTMDQSLQVGNTFTPDDLSCYNPINTIIEIIRLENIEITSINPSDCDGRDGEIHIDNYDNQNFEYSIDGGFSWSSEVLYLALDSGDINVSIRSIVDNTCQSELTIRLDDPEMVEITNAEIENITNCVNDDGSILCETNISLVEFSIDFGVTWQQNNTFNNLGPGAYEIIARNANGVSCQDTVMVDIEAFPETIIIDIQSEDVTECLTDNGSIIINAEGQNLEYSIDGGMTWTDDNTFTNLSDGNFLIEVRSKDSNNCQDSDEILLIRPSFPLLSELIISHTQDCKAADGTIEVDAQGVDLEYSIDNGQSWQQNPLFENLKAGDYTILIRQANTTTCQLTEFAILYDPEPIDIDAILNIDPTTCFLDSGQISIEMNSIHELEYSIDSGLSWQDNNTFENLLAGNYSILIQPKLYPNCGIEESTELILENQSIQIMEVITSQPSDCITDDAFIQVIVDLADVEFSIDNGISWQSNNLFNNLNPGKYEILIQKIGTSDCKSAVEFEAAYPACPCADLVVEESISHILCDEPNSGNIELVNVDGFFSSEDYTIYWSNGIEGSVNSNLTTGWYMYQIEYDKNCIWTDSLFINDFDPITFGLLSFDRTCKDEGQIEVIDFQGGSGQLNFSIDGTQFQESNLFYNLNPEQYSVFVMDQTGCFNTENITLNSIIDLSVELDRIDPIIINQSTFLNPLINQTTIDSFEWFPAVGILNPNELVANVAPRETTEYTLTIYFGDCTETRSVIVEVIDNRDIYVANMFTPNDFTNQIFFIQGANDLEVVIDNFNIYDRWGNLMFTGNDIPMNDPDFGWDGTFNNQPLDNGVFTYLIQYTLRGKQLLDTGTITLIK